MYNILITDDEKIIADGLYELVNKTLYPDATVYKAYSGKHAIEICKNNHIDILLTDVRMPEIDGFELQRQIGEILPDCSVIFLSAHNDFNYIQLALRGNSVDYVVKTEGDDAIMAAIKKALSLLETKRKNIIIQEKARESMLRAMPLLRKEYIIELLEGKDCLQENLCIRFIDFDISLDGNLPVLILIGRVNLLGKNAEPLKRMKNICGIQNIVEEKLCKSCVNVSIEYEHDKVLWLIQPKEVEVNNIQSSYESLASFVKESLEYFQTYFEELFEESISFAFSPNPVEWEALSKKFYTLRSSFNKSSGFKHKAVYILDEDEFNESDIESFKIHQVYIVRTQIKKISRLELLLENGHEEEFDRVFDEIANNIGLCRKINYNLLIEVYYVMSLMFLSYINRFGIKEVVSEKINLDLLMKMDDHQSWEGAIQYFKSFSKIIFELGVMENTIETNKMILDIENYISENLHSDVSLVKIAGALHFNPSYLSRVFKQATNKSVTEYIVEVKIKKVCEMLRNSNLKIYEIATMAGFESASYFNRFFKKHLTITPQEYRDKMLR